MQAKPLTENELSPDHERRLIHLGRLGKGSKGDGGIRITMRRHGVSLRSRGSEVEMI